VARPRKHDKHLPRNMQRRHGAYYFVTGNKWIRLAKEYGPALVQYAELVATPVGIVTVRDALYHYIESKKASLEKATISGYQHSATRLCAVFGPMVLTAVKAADVYRYLTEHGNVQANRDRALLSAAYTHARRIGSFSNRDDDPTKGLAYRNPEKPRQRYVTDVEMNRLIAAASPKLGTIARFIELTGMRQSDALLVQLTDLDEEGIHYTAHKTGVRLVVLWSAELKATVETAIHLWDRPGRSYLFESRPRGGRGRREVGPYTPSGLRALWRVARKSAGLSDVVLHDLRRKAGSDADSDQQAQDRLGHADAKVTRRHYRAKPKRVTPTR
jgi:integrase